MDFAKIKTTKIRVKTTNFRVVPTKIRVKTTNFIVKTTKIRVKTTSRTNVENRQILESWY